MQDNDSPDPAALVAVLASIGLAQRVLSLERRLREANTETERYRALFHEQGRTRRLALRRHEATLEDTLDEVESRARHPSSDSLRHLNTDTE